MLTHHIPDVVCQPVDEGPHTADQVQVLGLVDALGDQKHDEAGRHEAHGEHNADRHQHVYSFLETEWRVRNTLTPGQGGV